MSKEKKAKNIGLWVAAIFILLGLTQPWKWNWGSSEETSNSNAQTEHVEPQKNVDSDLIVIKPGDQFNLEVNSEKWSPMLDASHKGMHTSVTLRTDHLFKYSDGTVQKVHKEKPVKLKSDMYRIKTVEGKHTAVIKTAMSPINKSLYN